MSVHGRRGRAFGLPILSGGLSDLLAEAAREIRDLVVPDAGSDRADRVVAPSQQAAGFLAAQSMHEFDHAHPHASRETARQMSGAEVHPRRELVEAQRLRVARFKMTD